MQIMEVMEDDLEATNEVTMFRRFERKPLDQQS
jgi:hypothetical protein